MNREEILELYNSGPDAVVAIIMRMEARIAELEAEVADLKARLNQNSRNSGMPPSSDLFFRPKSQRVTGEKPRGGQTGHVDRTLRMVETPDNVVVHLVTVCGKCGVLLEKVLVLKVERRQVFDIPPLKIMVTEHRVEEN